MHVSYLPGFTPNLGDYDGFSKPPRLLAGLCSSRVVLSHSIALAFNPFFVPLTFARTVLTENWTS